MADKYWVRFGNELYYYPNGFGRSDDRFNTLEKGCSWFDDEIYDSIFSFFLDNQPDLSLVYEDIYYQIRNYREDDQIIDLIRDKYPEIYNYKGNTMELQKEVVALKQELADEKAKLAALESAFKESQKPVTQRSVGISVDDGRILYSDDGGAWQSYGTFETTTLPYIRPEIYNGVLSGLKVQADKQDDGTTKWTFTSESSESKPSPEPTEVVYVLRIQPDTDLHAKMIEFASEWSYADELIGIEKHYVFE